MNRRDATAELLQAARREVRETLLPELRGEARFTAAMIANAMGIAARDLLSGAQIRADERRALQALYGAPPTAGLEPLTRRLARDLRKGIVPGGDERRLRAFLRARTRGRLAISNPDLLAAAEGETGA
jgi:hypothetical protein